MPSVPIYPSNRSSVNLKLNNENALPPLLRTPSGLAILELQGTINIPKSSTGTTEEDAPEGSQTPAIETELGKIMFPDYSDLDPENTKWMKRVYLYAGQYQRMTGEVKKLAKPLALVQRRAKAIANDRGDNSDMDNLENNNKGDELEIVEIIKYKIIFASRPEPVGMD